MSEDGIPKIVFKHPLPHGPRKFKKSPAAHHKNVPVRSQARLNALIAGRVKPGEVLNPYGRGGLNSKKLGDVDHLGLRPEAMKRTRILLQEKKKIALEMNELQQLARENAVAAMEALIEISKSSRSPEASRIAAAAVILDRGYGKASQTTISANVTNGKANELTGDQLDRRIGQALKRVEDLTNRTPKAPESKKGPLNLRKYN